MATSSSIDQLNSFLRGELSAVETYRMAIAKFQGSSLESTLRECQQSHARRADVLHSMIVRLGGRPAESSGPWGAVARLFQGAADTFGVKAALLSLEEGEDHGLADYQRDLPSLSGDTRRVVESEILPAQQTTHRAMSDLKAASQS